MSNDSVKLDQEPSTKVIPYPKNSFAQTPESYEEIGENFFSLNSLEPALELPDLRRLFSYYGVNKRPDAQEENEKLFIFLKGEKEPIGAYPGEPLYLKYDSTSIPPKFMFSEKNSATELWIELQGRAGGIEIEVKMVGGEGNLVQEPKELTRFIVPEKGVMQVKFGSWMLDKLRVDGTLLARQKARWYGQDVFLERHGGDEFLHIIDKERIDFGEGEEIYSVFVGADDFLIWKEGRWQKPAPDLNTSQYPLLVVKKIADKLMNLELWEVEGKKKIPLNLIKSIEIKMPGRERQAFKFIGSRTRSLSIVEIDGKRMQLHPQDWLISLDKEWKKLESADEIDRFVERKLIGPLFIFEGVEKINDKQVIVGELYNASRASVERFEIAKEEKEAKKKEPGGRRAAVLEGGLLIEEEGSDIREFTEIPIERRRVKNEIPNAPESLL